MLNIVGKTEILKSLKVGYSTLWLCPEGKNANSQMKDFTAILTRFPGMQIKQTKALIVIEGEMTVNAVRIQRIA